MMGKGERSIRSDMKRVLLVEDNAFFLKCLKETPHARLPSIDILEAGSGEEDDEFHFIQSTTRSGRIKSKGSALEEAKSTCTEY
jgi:hypothetical protein